MKKLTLLFVSIGSALSSAFMLADDRALLPCTEGFSMSLCHSSYQGNVQSGDLYQNGKKIGHVIALNRTNKQVKAAYFASIVQGQSAYSQYEEWRKDKHVVLVSGGAYCSEFSGQRYPAGFSINHGALVNQSLDPTLDGLFVVDTSGGIRVVNLKYQDQPFLLDGTNQISNFKDPLERHQFTTWCADRKATVFQTHLLLYRNTLQCSRANDRTSARKLLVLCKDMTGHFFHFIIYSQSQWLTLYDMAEQTLQMMKNNGYDVIAAGNLDAGHDDVLRTADEIKGGCSGQMIEGRSRLEPGLCVLLAYHYE